MFYIYDIDMAFQTVCILMFDRFCASDSIFDFGALFLLTYLLTYKTVQYNSKNNSNQTSNA